MLNTADYPIEWQPKAGVKAYKYVFTFNNWDEEGKGKLKNLDSLWMIWCEEIAPTTGTPHLQGFIQFQSKRHWTALCGSVPGCYFAPAKGSAKENWTYIRKTLADHQAAGRGDDTFYEQGTRPNFEAVMEQRRAAGDATAEMWESARELARDGRFDEIPAQLYIQHMRNFQLIYREERNKRVPLADFTLRDWQVELMETLEGEVDNRAIYWFWEETGKYQPS